MTNIVCSVCGSTDVETTMWVNHKTGKVNGYFCDECIISDKTYNYCNNCNDHVELKIIEEI